MREQRRAKRGSLVRGPASFDRSPQRREGEDQVLGLRGDPACDTVDRRAKRVRLFRMQNRLLRLRLEMLRAISREAARDELRLPCAGCSVRPTTPTPATLGDDDIVVHHDRLPHRCARYWRPVRHELRRQRRAVGAKQPDMRGLRYVGRIHVAHRKRCLQQAHARPRQRGPLTLD